ncbi:ABC transporter permease [Actinoplanes sp. NBRC 101535]|uniref:ABC transporter permease n=1 Tax=Actinoplanes sp. NBRC 101535 TaxID=3032196 RepID=UPI0024A43F89|nr:ABC transporter permease [Actinoplanes sp. NBRC 101535]GLY06629.1 ABC transporter permease [Actinoplanes sp. NBRC 101535]
MSGDSPPSWRRPQWAHLAPLAALAALTAVWQSVPAWTGLDVTVLPPPSQVISAGWADRTAIAEATGATLQITLLGLLLSVGLAVVLAGALSFLRPLRQTMLPLLIGAQSVPVIVLAPLFIIWFGFGPEPKILLVAVVSMLPLTLATLQGLLSADDEAATLLRSMGASGWQVFLRLRVFSALPFFFTGLRIVASFVVVSAIFSEYVGAKTGLGIYMQLQKNLFRTDLVFAAVLVTIVIGLALFATTYLLEALTMPWERRRKAARR